MKDDKPADLSDLSMPLVATTTTPSSYAGVFSPVPASPPINPKWRPADPWVTVEYELNTFAGLRKVQRSSIVMPNIFVSFAVAESSMVHLRNLCEIFHWPLPKNDHDTDIRLSRLLADPFEPNASYEKLRELVKKLTSEYLLKREHGFSYKDLCDKMVMHPTTYRGLGGDYGEPLDTLGNLIVPIVRELESIRRCRFAECDE